ncbi:transcriptional regulator [Herminiimonas sp. CN]|uniref:transcriptional regulator n=1 Tax=Herminiimonas sp. CN TaxID=1349818 RepID=UPI000473273F|nr:transcriptional regulator [Herminiimonas sp. CN]
MNLKQWLSAPGNTAAKLSRVTGLTPPMISKMLHGSVAVSIKSALVLDKGTAGEIKAEEACPGEAELIAHLRGAT